MRRNGPQSEHEERSIDRIVLLTGASGYVGGRLLPRLERRGLRVRCLARRPACLAHRVGPTTEVVAGDALREDTLAAALEGVHTAYYLIHSMGCSDPEGFEAQDRRAARNFARAAAEAGVRRIIYLGGLADEKAALSAHLRSRHEVGRALRTSGVPVIELRASIVIGSGSLSFEMIRSLVDRLPVMITPRWVSMVAQPIAIDDLLAYLEAALELAGDESRVYEIGGAERVSYGELMREYARQRGLRRLTIPVPVLTPRLSSLWLGLVTPLYARVGRKLIASICHETVVHDGRARQDFGITPLGPREAIRRALAHEDHGRAPTRWSDARGEPRVRLAVLRNLGLALALLGALPGAAPALEIERADAVWARRAEGQVEGAARPERTRAAIAAYEAAVAARPEALEAHWKLLRALWFSAHFATQDREVARRNYERALEAAERAFAVLATHAGGAEALARAAPEELHARIPAGLRRDAAELYFWYAVNLGAWSRTVGLLQAVRAGVASRLHDATLRSIALDPDVEQGGGVRLLSRLHSELPRVPLLSGWVEHGRAVPLAERAASDYPAHPGNGYLLGLALLAHAPERRSEAIALIEAAAVLEPRSEQLVEDLATRKDAREELEALRRAR